jgi:glutathione-regulated potassium-efflux system protein KefB
MDVSHLMFAAAVVMLATALAVGVAKKLELGSTVAMLVVGIALGPHSPKPLFSGHVSEMEAIGEIGVMLLLFAIGLELQPSKLWSMRRLVLGLGAAQYVVTTVAIVAFLAAVFGLAGVQWRSALVAGLGLAMSSSAIPLPMLQERGETGTPQGRAVLAIDIFQGFMVIPVLALMPLLGAGAAHGAHGVSLEKTFEVLAAVGGVYLLASYALPWALSITARKLGPGGFFVIVLGSVFFAGWWMDAVGVSNALGAFMTGVLLSTTVFADQIKAAVSNSKRLLLAIFFIAIGMAIDPAQVAELKWELLFYVPSLLLIKFVVLFALAWLFGLGLRSAILTGLLSMPFDEIGYVIFASANASGLLTLRDYTIGITVISLSFVVSPVLINLGYRLTADLKAPAGGDLQPAPVPDATVVVAGYGPVGRVMCAMLERARIPYTAFTADAESLAKATKTRHNVLYGDLTDAELLDAIAIARARLVIVTMSDLGAVKHLIGNLRRFYSSVPAMIAVQYLAQRDELRRMGESEVVALAPEGTMSFGHSVLQRLGIKAAETDAIVSSMKAKDYAVLRATGEVEERGSGEGSLSSPPRGARPS